MAKRDFYEVLGLDRGAGADEIKKAYRKLALVAHPDKNTAPNADEAFKKVNKAFSCLKDAEKRSMYDQTGAEDAEEMASQQAARRARGGGGFHRGAGMQTPEDVLFNMFFGGGGARARGRDIRAPSASGGVSCAPR